MAKVWDEPGAGGTWDALVEPALKFLREGKAESVTVDASGRVTAIMRKSPGARDFAVFINGERIPGICGASVTIAK